MIGVALAVAAIPLAAAAQQNGNNRGAQPTFQVSGGGQIVASTSMAGPGTIIAFLAQGQGESGDEGPRGQLQIVDRNGPGEPRMRFHGTVDCIIPDFSFNEGEDDEVDGARFGGIERGGDDRFLVDVVDNGQPVDGTDLIAFRTGDVPECEQEEDDDAPEGMLGRGNVKINDRR